MQALVISTWTLVARWEGNTGESPWACKPANVAHSAAKRPCLKQGRKVRANIQTHMPFTFCTNTQAYKQPHIAHMHNDTHNGIITTKPEALYILNSNIHFHPQILGSYCFIFQLYVFDLSMWKEASRIYLSVVHWFQLALWKQRLSVLWQMSECPSFYMWTNVLLYVSTTYCLYPYDNAQITYLQGCCHESDCKIGSQIFAFNSFKYISSNRIARTRS